MDNDSEHVLYGIYDHERREMYKFGVATHQDRSKLPKRVVRQLFDWNRLVGFIRFTGRVLRWALPGRKTAYRAEDDAIDSFKEKRNRLPVGNDPHTYHQ